MSIFSSDIVKSAISKTTTEGGFVDIFVYDTSKDSDGGAWRHRTQHTSWYNEVTSATRGARKEFPSVAVIAVTTANLFIYDGDDPDLPLWMRFNQSTSGLGAMVGYTSFTIGCVHMLNGILMVGLDATNQGNVAGLRLINFISEGYDWKHPDSARNSHQYWPIEDRNGGRALGYDDGNYIVNESVNDVRAKVLPNTPIDDTTGLPVPTIAIATQGGVSVIRHDGTVVNKVLTDAGTDIGKVEFTNDDGFIIVTRNDYHYFVVTALEGAESQQHPSGFVNNINYFRATGTQYPAPMSPDGVINGYGFSNLLRSTKGTDIAMADTSGLNLFAVERHLNSNDNMVAYVTKDYNSGYQQGAIKCATLSDTDDTDKTNGQSESDRSTNNNDLTVSGTVTKSAVVSGADLVSYSGWQSGTYIQSIADIFNWGTGNFSFMFWVYPDGAGVADDQLMGYGDQAANDGFNIYLNADGSYSHLDCGYLGVANSFAASTGNGPLTGMRLIGGKWNHCTISMADDTFYLYVNGEKYDETWTGSGINWDTKWNSPQFVIGNRAGFSSSDQPTNTNTKLALVRASASVPTPEQVKKIYEHEKHMFKEDAKCTLFGTSDDVTAIDYDEYTETLHAGTSSGRSEFRGLVRINNTTTAVTTAISASDGFIAEQ